MPNQRAKNKIYLGGFVERALHAKILRMARRAGMSDNNFGFITELIKESIKRRKQTARPKRVSSLRTGGASPNGNHSAAHAKARTTGRKA